MAFNSTTPQIVLDTQNYTTSNCIAKIPDNIKLELDNNVLTLKKGSIVTLTGNVYRKAVISSDRTATVDTTNQNYDCLVFVSPNAIQTIYDSFEISKIGSGSTLPADNSQYTTFFNTSNMLIYRWNSAEQAFVVWATDICYPVCALSIVNGTASFKKYSDGRDCIFNGYAFIGQSKICFPGVEILESAGKNTNGTLKSRKYTTNSLQITTSGSSLNRKMYMRDNNFIVTVDNWTYNKDENLWYDENGDILNNVARLGNCYTNNDIVSDITFYQPYENANNLIINNCVTKNYPVNYTDLTTASNVATFTAPAGGVCYVYTLDTGTDREIFSINGTEIFNVKQIGTSGKTTTIPLTFILNKGDVLTCNHNWNTATFIPFN